MRTILSIIFTVLLAALAFAQPDGPHPQSPPPAVRRCGPAWMGGCWDYSRPTLSVGKTFKSPWFWGTVGAAEAATWADKLTSQAATDRGCFESNPDLPLRPTLGDRAELWAKTDLPLDAFMWAVVKLNRRPTNWIVTGMSAARVTIHLRGVAAALSCH